MQKDDITSLRKSLKMTQNEFAEFCGVTTRTIQKWEAGGTMPTIVCKFLELVKGETNSCFQKIENQIEQSSKTGNSKTGAETERFITVIESQLGMLRKSQEQIDRLITILENKE